MKAAGTVVAIVALAIASSAQSGKISVFIGAPGGVGDVRVFDETGQNPSQAPAPLQGIQLLSLDFAGRSMLTELVPSEPRLRNDVPGAARVRLPNGAGSLYRYRHDDPVGGPSIFGFFAVDFAGMARPLGSVQGTGLLGTDDPFPGRVGVSPSGDSLLVATSLAAGGDLLEIDVATGNVIDRTATSAPLDFLPGSLRLLPTWGAALSTSGPVRFDRQAGASASSVPTVPAAYIADGIVASADGSTLAYVAGPDPTQTSIFTFQRTGAANQALPAAMNLSGPGFLPDCPSGPTLALSPDGSEVAFRTEEGTTRECWSRPVSAPASPSFQITSNALFEDTLNDSGVIGYLGPNAAPSNTIVLVVGEQGAVAQALENADVYRLDPAAGGAVTVTNLTLTSGVTQPPFAKGQINVDDGFYAIPGTTSALYFQDLGSGTGEVRAVDVKTGAIQVLVDQVKSLDLVELAASELVLGMERTLTGKPIDLYSVPVSLATAPVLVGRATNACHFASPSTRPDGTFAAVLDLGGVGWLGRIQLPGGTGQLLTQSLLAYGPTIAFTPSGALAASVAVSSGTFVFTWSPTGALGLLPTGRVPSFVLPGA